MENIFILAIDRVRISTDYDIMNKHLKRKFDSVQYMRGYLDGYCFENYKLFTPAEFERAHNENISLEKYVMFILAVVEELEQ